jgi:hypothetical protein
MKSYAGIGSRDITPEEHVTITKIAKELSNLDYICYSGNACGSDITFQTGSMGKCVVFLPWPNFNFEENRLFRGDNCKDYFVVGNRQEGGESVNIFHPNPMQLSQGGRSLMSRNYYQIHGLNEYKEVDFVLCCADPKGKGVAGGTGQAVRIAQHENIPVINIRVDDWQDRLDNLLNPIF